MHFRILLVTVLCIGLNSSLCTGGIFAVTAAVTDQLSLAQGDSSPMSYGSIGYLSCKSSEREGNEVGSLNIGGCKNAETCFTQASSILEDRLVPIFVSFTEKLSFERIVFQPDPKMPNRVLLARTGPLYEHSIPQAHSLEKLE